jgi:DNA cross-link repair 1A protein
MGSTTFERMKTIAKYYKNRYDAVVAFKPTGWTFAQARKHSRATKRQKRVALIQYAVPYSEHSSFLELREFVQFLKPRAILPHVGNDRGENARRMVSLLTATEDEANEANEAAGAERNVSRGR